MYAVLDDVEAWVRRGARRNRTARVRTAVRHETVDAERLSLCEMQLSLIDEALRRSDVLPAPHSLTGIRCVVFMCGRRRYTVDFAARGSNTVALPYDVCFDR